MPPKGPHHSCSCSTDLRSRPPDAGATGRGFWGVVGRGRPGCLLPRESERAHFAADPERVGEMKRYPFRMTEAEEKRGSLQKTGRSNSVSKRGSRPWSENRSRVTV